jgi:PAS domain S-box-containing protein
VGDFKFTFSRDALNAIFPFYIMVNDALAIASFGNSIAKLMPELHDNDSFEFHFTIKKPLVQTISRNSLLSCLDSVVILQSKSTGVILRGQFEKTAHGFLFVGAPSLDAIDQVTGLSLTPADFAFHDPLLDLLHILKSHEINTDKLKDMLIEKKPETHNTDDAPEIKLAPSRRSTNKEGIVFLHPNGKAFWCNDAYLTITGYTRDDLFTKKPEEISKLSIDKEDMDHAMEYFRKGEPFDLTIQRKRKDGSSFWTKTKGQPIFNEAGVVTQYLTTVEDLTPQRARDQQLSLLSLIAEKNINPVLVCDSMGRIEWVSSNFVKTTGYSSSEAIGKRPGELLEGPETDPQTSMYIKNQAMKGLPVNAEILNYTKDGQKRWIKVHGQALHSKEGEVLKYYAIREDITDRKLMETQREELVKNLAKSNSELEDYAQIVSHDLKSPLHSIHSLISWIKEDNNGAFNDTTNQYFSLIEDKLEKMHDMIQGILTYSKIDRVDISKENIDIHEVVLNILSIIHIPATIQVTVKNRLPILKADRFRIQQLFQNIIANAAAYSDKVEGVIEITSEDHKDHYVFCIKDNGPGIAKDLQEKIFKKFRSFSDNEKSNGLGLSIAQKIVENYKGQIWVESEPGNGASFYIKLYK